MDADSRQRLRTPARATVWYFAIGVFSKGLGLLFTPIFTRLLTGEGYGAYSYYMSLLGFGGILISTLFSSGICYGGFEKFGTESFLSHAVRFALLTAPAIGLFIALFSGIGPTLGILLILQLISDAIVGLFLTRHKYSYGYKRIATLSLFSAVLPPVLSVFLIYFGGFDYRARIYSLLSVSLLAVGFVLFRVLKAGVHPEGGEREYIKRSALSQLPLAGANALSAEADKLIVARALGSTALAKYSVAFSLGGGLSFALNAVSSALCPWILRKIRTGDGDIVLRVTRLTLTLLCALALILIAAAPEALSLLAPSEYGEAVGAVMPIALSVIPSFGVTVISLVLTWRGLARISARLCSAGTLIGVLSCLILVPTLGYLGAGISVLISPVSSLILLMIRERREGGFGVISSRVLLVSITLAFIFGIFIRLLYDYAFLRFFFTIPPALVGLFALLEFRKYVFEKKQ